MEIGVEEVQPWFFFTQICENFFVKAEFSPRSLCHLYTENVNIAF